MIRIREGSAVAAGIALAVVLTACQDGRVHSPSEGEGEADSTRSLLASGKYNPRYVAPGAENASANPVAVPPALLPSVVLQNLVTNGSFETNGGVGSRAFNGWTALNPGGQGSWFVQTATASPPGAVYSVPPPTDGTFAAMTNQPQPGSHVLYQDVAIPASGAALRFDLFIGNRFERFHTPSSLAHTGVLNQQFRMDIVDPARPITDVANVLQMVYRTEVGDPVVSGYFTVTASLDAFAGRTIRLRFAEVDNQFHFQAGVDNVIVTQTAVIVDVDIKPGGDTNPVNLRSRGQLPVAILTTGDFDAAEVDPASLTLGDDDGDDTPVITRRSGHVAANLEDVDEDGDLDLILHFDTQALVGNGDLHAGTTALVINGKTGDGTPIHGSDAIRVVPFRGIP